MCLPKEFSALGDLDLISINNICQRIRGKRHQKGVFLVLQRSLVGSIRNCLAFPGSN